MSGLGRQGLFLCGCTGVVITPPVVVSPDRELSGVTLSGGSGGWGW